MDVRVILPAREFWEFHRQWEKKKRSFKARLLQRLSKRHPTQKPAFSWSMFTESAKHWALACLVGGLALMAPLYHLTSALSS
jgi:hypothetical protein